MSDPQPMLGVSRPTPAGREQSSRRWVMLGAVAVLTGAVAAVHFRAAVPTPDEVDAAEVARRGAALAAAGPLPLGQIAASDAAAALVEIGLSAADTTTLTANVTAGRVRLVRLSVFDSDVEDGDVAEIRSAGFRQVVPLTRAPIVLAVPVGPDNTIEIAGLVDGGGGGVTVGLVLLNGPLPLPPLSVGQVLRLPIGPLR